MDTIISVRELRKEFELEKGRKLLVLDKISFDVESGSMTTIVGFSGSGKNTLLKLLAGLEPITSGTIQVSSNGSGKPSRIGYVFQNARLLARLTIEDNLMFVRKEDVDLRENRQRVQKYLNM